VKRGALRQVLEQGLCPRDTIRLTLVTRLPRAVGKPIEVEGFVLQLGRLFVARIEAEPRLARLLVNDNAGQGGKTFALAIPHDRAERIAADDADMFVVADQPAQLAVGKHLPA
jgi:hypothetical protein